MMVMAMATKTTPINQTCIHGDSNRNSGSITRNGTHLINKRYSLQAMHTKPSPIGFEAFLRAAADIR